MGELKVGVELEMRESDKDPPRTDPSFFAASLGSFVFSFLAILSLREKPTTDRHWLWIGLSAWVSRITTSIPSRRAV